MIISQIKTNYIDLLSSETNIINKKIETRRLFWNRYLTIILDLFVKDFQMNNLTEIFIDKIDAHVLSYDYKLPLDSQKTQLEIIKDYPKIYVIGGSAYLAYYDFINMTNTNYSTYDYDILIALTKLNEDNFKKILDYLKIRLQLFAKVISIGVYLESHFEEFNETDINEI